MGYPGGVGGAPVGALAVGALGDPLPAIVPLAAGGTRPTYRIKILDPVTGAVLIDDLPHLQQVVLDEIGFQAGATGRSVIGTFEAKLPPRRSDAYKTAKQVLDRLDYGQRIEIYRGDGLGGDPRFSGWIRSIAKTFTEFTIRGDDSLGRLQLTRTPRAAVFSGRTDQLFQYALKPYDLVFGDDFSAGLGNFTNDGGWTQTTDPVLPAGLNAAITPGKTGDGILLSTQSFSNAQYADCSVEASFRSVTAPAAGAYAEVSVIAAASDLNNLVMGQMLVRYVSPTRYEVDFIIRQKVGGVFTVGLGATVQAAYALPGAQLPGALELRGFQADANNYLWRLMLNGADVGCFWVQPVANGAPSGKIGLRSAFYLAPANNEIVYVAGKPDGLAFWSKNAWFLPGRVSMGTQTVKQAIPDTPFIDLLTLAVTTENGEFRKNPKAGLNQDTVDFGLAVGTDRSSQIRFDEETNVTDVSIEPNAEPFGTVLQSPANPSLGGAGFIKHTRIAAVQSRGAIMLPTPASRVADLLAHRLFAQQLAALSASPGKAKRIKVKRSPDVEQIRPLDWVKVNLPGFNINEARLKVFGVKDDQGQGDLEFLVDQYPVTLDRVPAADRLIASSEARNSRVEELTATDPAAPGQLVRSSQIVQSITPYRMRVYMSGLATQNVVNLTQAIVNFDTILFDIIGGFSTTTHKWTVPVSGDYLVIGALLVSSTNSIAYQQLEVLLFSDLQAIAFPLGLANGTATIYNGTASSIAMSTYVSDAIPLIAGDTVSLQFIGTDFAGGVKTFLINGGQPSTYWAMRYIGG